VAASAYFWPGHAMYQIAHVIAVDDSQCEMNATFPLVFPQLEHFQEKWKPVFRPKVRT
jgi:hypothetical protein